MARGVLILGAVTSVGCVIPTSLQVVEQPANYPPVIVSELCSPALESTIPDPAVAPHIVVDDLDAANPDNPETLKARIFKQQDIMNGTMVSSLLETQLASANSPDTPNRYFGDFPKKDWCALFTNGGTVDVNFVVIVADRPFAKFPHEDQVQGDATDGGATSNEAQAGWRLHCQ